MLRSHLGETGNVHDHDSDLFAGENRKILAHKFELPALEYVHRQHPQYPSYDY
jgi:hypothetical protein